MFRPPTSVSETSNFAALPVAALLGGERHVWFPA
jgi:hypothetical protein